MNVVVAMLLSFSFFSCSSQVDSKNSVDKASVDYMALSIEMLEKQKRGEQVEDLIQVFALSTLDEVSKNIDTQERRIAFWVNIYNAYILAILNKNPELYEDRRQFFKQPYIEIAGRNMSFADIEHGIIRRSQKEYFLGYVGKLFPPKYQRVLRPQQRDYRVHFALNCGAKSCPPISIMAPENLDTQLDQLTAQYLSSVTSYDIEKNKVTTSPLCSWFRGDFKGKKGVRKILLNLDLIPSTKVGLEFGDYDWTLALNNFAE